MRPCESQGTAQDSGSYRNRGVNNLSKDSDLILVRPGYFEEYSIARAQELGIYPVKTGEAHVPIGSVLVIYPPVYKRKESHDE